MDTKGTQLRDKCEAGIGPISNHTQGLKKQLLTAKIYQNLSLIQQMKN